jgi:PAS domain S-box-containing protein
LNQTDAVRQRTTVLFREELNANHKRTDRLFAWLMVIQWLAGIAAALLISPRAWAGTYSHIHIHVWVALFLGGMISGFPVFMAVTRAGSVLTRHVIAVGQMLSCGLLVHLMGGRIEAHFQYFGILAFLAFYRDWRVLLTGTAVAAADHCLRGLFWPESMFGVLVADWWRWLEHVGWVLFEDVFLLLAIRQNLQAMLGMAERQAALETVNETIERKVGERTSELRNEIAERVRAEESLRLLGSAVEQSKESIVITDAELDLPGPRIIFVNRAFTQMTGYTAAEAIGKTPRILQGARTDKAVLGRLRKNLEHGEIFSGEAVQYRKDGTEYDQEWQIAPLRDSGGKITHFVAIQHDITERKRLEGHLFQSQKMETVGKLAGGIAHEFNSIMTAIIGHSELLLADLPPENPPAKSAAEIRKAAERAATLTRQLLAYGRKQILQPEILDLNAVIAGMENTLLHLMGRDVQVHFSFAAGLKSVKADAGQIEQVIVNVAMNAADAMPNGGKLTIETANVTLDAGYVSRFPELKAGEFVMFAMGDSGAGMTDAVKARVFEPFFTTKGVGEGTGLGLATCHGIIKQSGGHIAVYSELGRGTTFKIYLPQAGQKTETKISGPAKKPLELPRGTETILLVEDDPSLRAMAAALLGRWGYTVLAAANGVEAMVLVHQPGRGHIDLLFTDVVMPQMSGNELADRIRTLHPQTKILFASAYTESAIVQHGVLEPGIAFLPKPYTPAALMHKVRELLDCETIQMTESARAGALKLDYGEREKT